MQQTAQGIRIKESVSGAVRILIKGMTDKDARTRFEIGTVLQIMEQLKAEDLFYVEVREAEYVELVENYLLNFDSVKDRDLPQEFKNIALGRPFSGFQVSVEAQTQIRRLVEAFEAERHSAPLRSARKFPLPGGFSKGVEEAKHRVLGEGEIHSPSENGKQLYRKLQNFYNSKTFKRNKEPAINVSSLMHKTERSTDFMHKLKSASKEPMGRDSSLKAAKGAGFNPLLKFAKVKPYNFSGKNINSMMCLYAQKERVGVSKEPVGKQSQSIGKSGSRVAIGGGKQAVVTGFSTSRLRPAPQFSHDLLEVELSTQIDKFKQLGAVSSKSPTAALNSTHACDKESIEHSKSNFSGLESRIRTEPGRVVNAGDRESRRNCAFVKGKSSYLFTQRQPVKNKQPGVSQQDFDKIKLIREKSADLRSNSASRQPPENIIKFLIKIDQKAQNSSRTCPNPPKRPILNKPFSTTMSHNYKSLASAKGMKDLLSKMRNSCINERFSKTHVNRFVTTARNSANVKLITGKKKEGPEKLPGLGDNPFGAGKLSSFRKSEKPDVCGSKK